MALVFSANAMKKTIYEAKDGSLKIFKAALWRKPHIAFAT
jgi:hypothetical protein